MALTRLSNQSLTSVTALPAAISTGKVLQVLQTSSTSSQTISNHTSFTDITNMSLAITPSATSSKIYVIVDLSFDLDANDRGFQIKILRDSTSVFSENTNKSTYSSASVVKGRNIYDKLDSPSTTSQITYKVQAQTDSGGGVIFQPSSNPSHITLMEISS